MNMDFKSKLPIPMEVKKMYPVTEEMKLQKEKNDEEIRKVFTCESDKLILIIGPCSADREDAVLDYMKRLRLLQDEVKDEILIIPRVYTNKPRTTGAGYKGMLHQPDPNGKPDMLRGVVAIRKLHMDVLKALVELMKCYILIIIDIYQIFYHTLPLAQDQLKISNIVLPHQALIHLLE